MLPLKCIYPRSSQLQISSLLEVYNDIHQYDLICVSETDLDLSISNDEEGISVKECSLVRADHPPNPKQGEVCIYYKESLSVCIINVSNLTVYYLSSYDK